MSVALMELAGKLGLLFIDLFYRKRADNEARKKEFLSHMEKQMGASWTSSKIRNDYKDLLGKIEGDDGSL